MLRANTTTASGSLSRRSLLRVTANGAAGVAGLLGLVALGGCSLQTEQEPAATNETSKASSPAATSAAPKPLWEPGLSKKEAIAKFAGQPAGAFGLEVPGIQLTLPAGSQGVALSFDACGGAHGSKIDQQLIETLRKYQAPATLFINQRWARVNRKQLIELITDPLFEIANHGTTHVPLTVAGQRAYGIPGTGSVAQAYDEVVENQLYLAQEFGVVAKFFRSGTAHMDQPGVALCRKLGLVPMNFSVNMDAGATFTAANVTAQVASMRHGDVGIGHFNQPGSGTAAGVRAGLARLADAGMPVVPLRAG